MLIAHFFTTRHTYLKICALLILLVVILPYKQALAAATNGIDLLEPHSHSQGIISVNGVADDPFFQKWQIDLLLNQEESQAQFVALGETPQPTPGRLTAIDTTHYPNGRHSLRLRVVRRDGNYDEYVRPLTIFNGQAQPDETPLLIGQNAPPGRQWIEVDLSDQTLTAWQGETAVFMTQVSTGKPGHETIQGEFAIYAKLSKARMVGRNYDTPDVPWTMYFAGDFGIHGAYWHNNFGTPVSHGCVNLRVAEAQALFAWATVGTTVVVHE